MKTKFKNAIEENNKPTDIMKSIEKNKVILPTDEEIDKQFPIEENPNFNKRGNIVYSIERARMKARREGAKWMKNELIS